MRITRRKLQEIIQEELATCLEEAYTTRQRRWACAQDDPELEKVCTGPMKKKKVEEGWFSQKEEPPVSTQIDRATQSLADQRAALRQQFDPTTSGSKASQATERGKKLQAAIDDLKRRKALQRNEGREEDTLKKTKSELLSRIQKLLAQSFIDLEGLAALTRVVHDLEGLYPLPRERKASDEDWTRPQGGSHFDR